MAINIPALVQDVQTFLQDEPMLNLLLNRREFSESMIKLAIKMMVGSFNRTHFQTNFSVVDFPDGLDDIVIYGTVYHLLNMATNLQTRNHLPYNDAGLSVAQFSKSGEYAGIADRFEAMFEKGATQVKYDLNIRAGWGGVPSEYMCLSAGWASIYGH